MGIVTLYKWKCDLCGREEQKDSTVQEPVGWIKICLADNMEDRKFHDKCICSGCIQEIDTARKKLPVKKPSGGCGILA